MGLQLLARQIMPNLAASVVERLAQQIAIARGELKHDAPLCTLPASVASERRAMARLVLGPDRASLETLEKLLRDVVARKVYGAPFDAQHPEDQDELGDEAHVMLETVLDYFSGLPVAAFETKGRIF